MKIGHSDDFIQITSALFWQLVAVAIDHLPSGRNRSFLAPCRQDGPNVGHFHFGR